MPATNDQIVEILPHLQRYAWHLTRRRDEADDLVQDCVERAMLRSGLFQPGTNLRAWMFTMMRNIFINGKRRQAVADRHFEKSSWTACRRSRHPSSIQPSSLAPATPFNACRIKNAKL